MAVRFFDQGVSSNLKNKRKLSGYLQSLIEKKNKIVHHVDLTYVFCNDEYLLGINQEFLDHNTFTDIITFDLSETSQKLVGEIYISVDRVKENAEKFRVKYELELHRVIFHGALHLCGFKDKTKQDKERMSNEEDACLKEYFQEGK